MTRTVLHALLFACSAGASAADLVEVFRQAQTSDATYAAARSTWAAAQERIPQGRAGLLPLASLSASAQSSNRGTRFRDDTTPRIDTDSGSTGLSLSVTQPLYRKQNAIAYEQARTQVGQADVQLALAAQDLILRVAQAYFDILLAQDNVVFAEMQKTAIGEQLEQAKRNYEVGTSTITDTHEAQARYDLTAAQEITARNDLELRKRALEQVISQEAPPLAPLGPRFTLKAPEPARMEPWVGLAQQGNLQVRVAHSALTFAGQEIARNRAAHYPTLDAFATLSGSGANRDSIGGVGTDTRNSVIGIQLAFPLYQGGLVNSRVREAIANQARSGDELETARRAAAFSARQAFLGITNGIAQVQALEAALVSTGSQLDSTRVGRDVGVRTQVDVLNAQQLLFSASRDLAQSKYNYVMSLLRLEAAIGELTEDDLVAVNQWLDKNASTASTYSAVLAAATAPPAASLATPTPAKPDARKKTEPVKATTPEQREPELVLRTLEQWARAWASNDVEGYLAHYAPDFEPPRGLTRAAWEAERKTRIQKPRKIEVELESPAVTFDAQDRASVAFRQQYRSGSLNVISDKTLVMVRRGDQWLIQEERLRAEFNR